MRAPQLLYTLDTVDTRGLAAAEKVLLAARDYGLHWLRAELTGAQRQATQRLLASDEAAGADSDSDAGSDFAEQMWRRCACTHALLAAPPSAAAALVSRPGLVCAPEWVTVAHVGRWCSAVAPLLCGS